MKFKIKEEEKEILVEFKTAGYKDAGLLIDGKIALQLYINSKGRVKLHNNFENSKFLDVSGIEK